MAPEGGENVGRAGRRGWQDSSVRIHEIRFDRQERDDLGEPEVVPRVDGVPLAELVERFELDAGMESARRSSYGGLIRPFWGLGPIDEHFLGRTTPPNNLRTPLLACDCGEWACWPLLARVTVADELITWDDFHQPHRPDRDYTGFGPFRFRHDHYEQSLRQLVAALRD
jgi:hypothetical protein